MQACSQFFCLQGKRSESGAKEATIILSMILIFLDMSLSLTAAELK